jgi:hypothetical protein
MTHTRAQSKAAKSTKPLTKQYVKAAMQELAACNLAMKSAMQKLASSDRDDPMVSNTIMVASGAEKTATQHMRRILKINEGFTPPSPPVWDKKPPSGGSSFALQPIDWTEEQFSLL